MKKRGTASVRNPNSLAMKFPTAFSSSSTSSLTMSPTSAESRNWQELPRDVMVTILMKLDLRQILEYTQFVCKSWYEACKDPLAWTKVKIINWDEPDSTPEKYERMTSIAIDRSCGRLGEIDLQNACDDSILKQISRASQLRSLRISCCYSLSSNMIRKAFNKLPLLEEVELVDCFVDRSAIRSIGRSCPKLYSFKLNHSGFGGFAEAELENRVAQAIAEYMPHIRRLQLIGCLMRNKSLQAILDSCSSLESLDLRCCLLLDLSDGLGKRCAEKVNDFKWPHESVSDCGFPEYDTEDEYKDLYEDDDEDDYKNLSEDDGEDDYKNLFEDHYKNLFEDHYKTLFEDHYKNLFEDYENVDDDDDDEEDDDEDDDEEEDDNDEEEDDEDEDEDYQCFDEWEHNVFLGNYNDSDYFDGLTQDDYAFHADLEHDLFFGGFDDVFSNDSDELSDDSIEEETKLDSLAMQMLFGDTEGSSFGPNAETPGTNQDLGEMKNVDTGKDLKVGDSDDEINAEAKKTLEMTKKLGFGIVDEERQLANYKDILRRWKDESTQAKNKNGSKKK